VVKHATIKCSKNNLRNTSFKQCLVVEFIKIEFGYELVDVNILFR